MSPIGDNTKRALPAGAIAIVILMTVSGARPVAANEGGVSLFVRADTDDTVVVSPRASGRVQIEETNTEVTAAYSADIWTSASIDIRTAATGAITEQRDQIDASVTQTIDDVTLGASYYFSGENDYWSNGVTVNSSQEIGATTIDESFRFVHDIIGRSGDQAFNRPADSGTLRLAVTQILSPQAIVQGVYEGTYRSGYQASPYRFVGLGGDGMCGGTAVFCVPEAHPEVRFRNAWVARGRYGFAEDASVGLGYRFYLDNWGVRSHTAVGQVAWIPAPEHTLTVRYRFYHQTAASFYQSVYGAIGEDFNFATRDRELSPLISNRLAVSYQARAHFTESVGAKISLAVGGSAFLYSDFVGLSEVFSIDATLAFTLEL